MFGVQGELFHVGIRVRDVAAALAEMTESHGISFTSIRTTPMQCWLPAEGHVTKGVELAFSCEGPVHLEVMSGPAGSLWDGREVPGPHHLGYWVDDVRAETEKLLSHGWKLELAATSPDEGYGRFTYLRSPFGELVEPVASSSRERFQVWWDGGELAPSVVA